MKRKLPLIDIALLAYLFLAKNVVQLALALVQMLLVMFGLQYALVHLGIVPEYLMQIYVGTTGNWSIQPISNQVWNSITLISGLYLFSAIYVGINRKIILQEKFLALRFFQMLIQLRTVKFFLFLLIFHLTLLFLLAPEWLLPVQTAYFRLNTLPWLAPSLALIFIFFVWQYIFVMPSLAADEFSSLSACRDRLKGNAWRSFFSVVVTILPVILVALLTGYFLADSLIGLAVLFVLQAFVPLASTAAVAHCYVMTGRQEIHSPKI